MTEPETPEGAAIEPRKAADSLIGGTETLSVRGLPLRAFQVGLSAEALALAWARQQNAPAGAAVVVVNEVSPRGRAGRLWPHPADDTLAFAVILRPTLSADDANAVWLAAGVAVTSGAGLVSDRELATCWPDQVIDVASGEEVAMTKAEIQLGPGQVRSAVATVRLSVSRLGLDPEQRGDLLEALLASFAEVAEELSEQPTGVAAMYEGRCSLVGSRIKVVLLPKGETRGVVRGVDPMGRLRLESGTGMIEHLEINTVRSLEVV
ncbi:biotin--[acetyl-CoA-carboxylase] ligase [soil metagenome]